MAGSLKTGLSFPLKRNWQENRWLLLILTFGLILRLFILFTDGEKIFLGTDDGNYIESAEILRKDGILTYGGWPEPTVFIMPGYPVFLAVIFTAAGGTIKLAVRLVQVLISIAQIWFGARLGYRMGGRNLSLLAAGLLAIYPPNLTTPNILMTETVFTTLLLAGLYCFVKAEEAGNTKGFVVTGIILGLATYFRPTGGLLPVVFGFYLLMKRYPWQKVVYAAGIMGFVVVLSLSPWIARNYIIYREFIPFTVSSGNPFLRGTYINNVIDEKFPWVEGQRILSDRAQMEYGKKRLIEGFRTDFKGYLHWYTVGKFLSYWSEPYYYKELPYFPEVRTNMFHRVILITGAAGMLLGLYQRRSLALLFLLVAGYFTLTHIVYLAAPRYSYPVVQLVIVLAAFLAAEGAGIVRGLLFKDR